MLRQLRQEFHKNSTISSIFTQLRQNLHMLRQNLHILSPCQVETSILWYGATRYLMEPHIF